MTTIKVEINQEKNFISVFNNGKGIPVQIHKEHNIYIPELIFGNLLTSSNYDDSVKKITGGRNGFGAKLTNIFSKKFIIETVDTKNKKKYSQTFLKNMSEKSPAEISTFSKGEEDDYTKITFEPDLKKFKMKELENDIVSLLKKRVYDAAGTTTNKISVFLNGKKIEIQSFKEYTEMYLKNKIFNNDIEYPKLFDNPHSRWELMVTIGDSQFQQVSFVNGICTTRGGTHVQHIIEQITEKIILQISKKNKDLKLKPNQIKQNLWIFLNCHIENPAFNSQTKEALTTQESAFGSKCLLSEKYLTSIIKSPIFLNIIENAKAKDKIKLHKSLSSNLKKSCRILNINKLEDANLAGTKNFENCTLIITEGDSAKSLAMSGIELVGRDTFGVYPLKGKFLNVREASQTTIINNKEMQDLIKILGLKMGQDYSESLKGLRYGHLMIMADQDFDGSHIKGLVLNFFHFFWPSLLKRNDFLKEFITPIVKVSKFDKSKSLNFYTINEYKSWYEENCNKNNQKNNKSKFQWNIKYYKGLGTSTAKEAKEYFKNIIKNRIDFKYKNQEDDEAIELAFSNKKADMRKEWLSNLEVNSIFIDHTKCEIRYKEFIDKELILFSHSDNIRSIPNLLDGLKPSERKILFSAFKRNLKSELKVAQLAGYVAEHSSYHHGEMALCSTITSMAQDFLGSNNINLLLPIGQFGNRYNGTKGAASPRYIYTCLNKITRMIYKEEDDNLFTYIVEEGQKIEPIYYVPILPMVLVNGCDGIGTGWSTNVPQYNPLEIAEFLIKRLNSDFDGKNENENEDENEFSDLNIKPWYKGFKGEIIKTEKGYNVIGCIEILTEDNIVEITELPPRRWDIRNYKTFLEEFHVDNNEKTDKEIELEDIKEYHSENKVYFRLKVKEEHYKKISNYSQEDLLKLFKLTTTIGNTNMVLFNSDCKIKKYSKIKEIFEEFFSIRLDYYVKRREALLNKLNYQLDLNTNKMNFIKMMLTGEVNFLNMNKKEVCEFLRTKNFEGNSELKKKYKNAFKINSTDIVKDEDSQEEKENDNKISESEEKHTNDFDYLMNMNIWSLTKDRINELENNVKNLNGEINFFKENDEKKLWILDLQEFIEEYKKILSLLETNNEKDSKFQSDKISSNKNEKQKIKKEKKNIKKSDLDLNESNTEDEFNSDFQNDNSFSGEEINSKKNNNKNNGKKENKKNEEKNNNEKKKKSDLLLNKKTKKNEDIEKKVKNPKEKDSFIEDSYSSEEEEVVEIKKTTKRSTIKQKENNERDKIKENNLIKNNKKNKIIVDDDNESEDFDLPKNQIKSNPKKIIKDEDIKITEVNEKQITNNKNNEIKKAQNNQKDDLIMKLNINPNDLNKKIEKSLDEIDSTKLSLKERIALKTKQAKLDSFLAKK